MPLTIAVVWRRWAPCSGRDEYTLTAPLAAAPPPSSSSSSSPQAACPIAADASSASAASRRVVRVIAPSFGLIGQRLQQRGGRYHSTRYAID